MASIPSLLGSLAAKKVIYDMVNAYIAPTAAELAKPPAPPTLLSVRSDAAEHRQSIRAAIASVRLAPDDAQRRWKLAAAIADARAFSDSVIKYIDGHELAASAPEMCSAVSRLMSDCHSAEVESEAT